MGDQVRTRDSKAGGIITAPGQPAAAWTGAVHRLDVHEPADLLDLAAGRRLVVAVPHPDDETLAVGGLLQRLQQLGVHLVLVLATAGEAAYDEQGEQAMTLGRTRIAEFHRALAALGLSGVQTHLLGFPDGMVEEHEPDLRDQLSDLIDMDSRSGQGPSAVLAPWVNDPHPDHRAVGRAAGAAARRAGSMAWSYPVWMRHVLAPDDPRVPWDDLRRVALGGAERANKSAAIEMYASQLAGPSPSVGAVLPPYVLEHFSDGNELLIRPAPGADEAEVHFDALYEGDEDPWRAGTSWYERRKRSVLLASLPRGRYRSAWEPGCSLGHLSAELARRCERLLVSDVSPRAVAATRARVIVDHVTIELAQTPDQPPDIAVASCDLVVLSELLYYLPDQARAETIALAHRLLEPGGHLVVAHWRGHPADAHCSGEQANAEVVAAGGKQLVHHLDEQFVLDICGVADICAPADVSLDVTRKA